MSQPITLSFTSTTEDVVAAYDHQLRLECRPFFRVCVGVLGSLWVIGSLAQLSRDGFSIATFIFLSSGGILLKRWVITPLITRKQVMSGEMAGTEPDRNIELTFDEAQIRLTADNEMEKTYGWNLVQTVYEMKNGFLFIFTDGPVHWVPDRTFREASMRRAFESLLRRKTKLVPK